MFAVDPGASSALPRQSISGNFGSKAQPSRTPHSINHASNRSEYYPNPTISRTVENFSNNETSFTNVGDCTNDWLQLCSLEATLIIMYLCLWWAVVGSRCFPCAGSNRRQVLNNEFVYYVHYDRFIKVVTQFASVGHERMHVRHEHSNSKKNLIRILYSWLQIVIYRLTSNIQNL